MRYVLECKLIAQQAETFQNEAVMVININTDSTFEALKLGILLNPEDERFTLYVISMAKGCISEDEYEPGKINLTTHHPTVCENEIQNALSFSETLFTSTRFPKQKPSNKKYLRQIKKGSTAINISYDPFSGKGKALTFQNEYIDYEYSFLKENDLKFDPHEGKKLNNLCPIAYGKSMLPTAPKPNKPHHDTRFRTLFGHINNVPIRELVRATGKSDHFIVKQLQQVRA